MMNKLISVFVMFGMLAIGKSAFAESPKTFADNAVVVTDSWDEPVSDKDFNAYVKKLIKDTKKAYKPIFSGVDQAFKTNKYAQCGYILYATIDGEGIICQKQNGFKNGSVMPDHLGNAIGELNEQLALIDNVENGIVSITAASEGTFLFGCVQVFVLKNNSKKAWVCVYFYTPNY